MSTRKIQFKLYVSEKRVNRRRSTNPFAKMEYRQLQKIATKLFLPATMNYKLLLALIIARTNNREDIVRIIIRTVAKKSSIHYKNYEINFPGTSANSSTKAKAAHHSGQNGCILAASSDYFNSDKAADHNLSSCCDSTMENGPSQEISTVTNHHNNCCGPGNSCFCEFMNSVEFYTGIHCGHEEFSIGNANPDQFSIGNTGANTNPEPFSIGNTNPEQSSTGNTNAEQFSTETNAVANKENGFKEMQDVQWNENVSLIEALVAGFIAEV